VGARHHRTLSYHCVEERKVFFSEEKKQKTFISARVRRYGPWPADGGGAALFQFAPMRYYVRMDAKATLIEDDEDAAEAKALALAIAAAEADPRRVPHEDVRAWLKRLAEGEFDAPPPEPR
jgi:hypothetical protein